MTLPFPPDQIPAAPAEPLERAPVQFPLGWLLSNASSAVQYRAIIDVSGLGIPRDRVAALALGFVPALRLAMAQSAEGTWGNSILGVPSTDDPSQVGTIPAFRRLIEYGWDRESPPLIRARRVLFRLLAEDNDADQLYEFRAATGSDPDLIHRARGIPGCAAPPGGSSGASTPGSAPPRPPSRGSASGTARCWRPRPARPP